MWEVRRPFGDVAREDVNEKSDEKSGVDMWDDDVILNPLSDSDAEEAESMTFYQGERTL